MIRTRYNATQIIWECKNREKLSAADFHQAAYYMTEEIGRFIVIVFRGKETASHYYSHVKRIATDKKGLVLLLNERDMHVFLRQAIHGKVKEEHIYDLFDNKYKDDFLKMVAVALFVLT